MWGSVSREVKCNRREIRPSDHTEDGVAADGVKEDAGGRRTYTWGEGTGVRRWLSKVGGKSCLYATPINMPLLRPTQAQMQRYVSSCTTYVNTT